jgi:hypothetical protein
VSNFVKFEGFSLCFYVIGPDEFVIEVDSNIAGNFHLGNHIIIEGHWGAKAWS